MKKIISALSAVAAITILSVPTFAQEEIGGYAGTPLEIKLSPRATGMGGAYTAVSDDIYGLFVNPGAAAQMQNITFGAAYRDMSLGRSMQQIAALFPVRGEAALGITAQLATVKDVLGRTTRGEPTENLDNLDMAASIIFSRRFSRFLTIGGDARYYYKKLAAASAYSAGFDFGAMLHLDTTSVIKPESPLDLVRLAFVVRNIEAKYPWSTGDYWNEQGMLGSDVTEKVPVIVKVGGSVLALDRKLLIAVDGEYHEELSAGLYAGVEYRVVPSLALRGGMARGEPAFGAGFMSDLGSLKLQIDLAVEQERNLGGWETIVGLIVSR